jgi:glycosyltransferase involved in cell wall biosynthesis
VRITHLTLLNPVTHPRIAWKQALSQQQAGHQVTVIGTAVNDPAGKAHLAQAGITLLDLPPVRKTGLARLMRPWSILKLALQQRADAYHLHTPELLGVGLWLRLFTRARVVYDVHEDYRANYVHLRTDAQLFATVFGALLGLAERIGRSWVHRVVYAEECYTHLGTGPDTAVVRNTFRPIPAPAEAPPTLQDPVELTLCSTGTLCYDWGTTRALQLWIRLNEWKALGLELAGNLSTGLDRDIVRYQLQLAGEKLMRRFQLHGGDTWLPYPTLQAVQQRADVHLALYTPLPHLIRKFPTRFYEALALGKPLVYLQSPYWDELNQRFQLGASLPWRNLHRADIRGQEELLNDQLEALKAFLERIAREGFRREADVSSCFWTVDEKRLLGLWG